MFRCIFEQSTTFKDTIFEITKVVIPIFKPFLAHTTELRIMIVPPFKRPHNKFFSTFLLLVPLVLDGQKGESQPITNAPIAKANMHPVLNPLDEDVLWVVEIYPESPGMLDTDKNFKIG